MIQHLKWNLFHPPKVKYHGKKKVNSIPPVKNFINEIDKNVLDAYTSTINISL